MSEQTLAFYKLVNDLNEISLASPQAIRAIKDAYNALESRAAALEQELAERAVSAQIANELADHYRARAAALQEQVKELTAERNEWQGRKA